MDEQTSDFFNPPSEDAPAPPADSEPIVLGAPPPSDEPIFMGPPMTDDSPDFAADFAAPPADFAAPRADSGFIGDVDEGSPAVLIPEPPAEETAFAIPAPETAGEEPVEGAGELLPKPIEETKEPSPMQKWNDEWQVTLKERKDNENAEKAEVVEQARADLENFQTERDTRREQRMSKNRTDEQEKLEAIEADLENDNSWQRVVKLVELTHDNVDDAADVARMRDVLIQLKNEPARATILTN
uniref:Clathrin light chain n=1 Tax=Odontella aurita TaxID=265563 RepID=A0A7S4HN92_9STRA|mmetsp:Transcript_12634/g.37246  ORF Transcript_12634/g.37246 Transcript_12634/m.37246 type:complete len:242 (+) Transcript_12634:169-894(+)